MVSLAKFGMLSPWRRGAGGRAGLRLLKSQAEGEAAKLARLRAAVQLGLDEIERGEGIEVRDIGAWLDGLGRERTV